MLDNLSSHKSEKAKAILEERGAWFLFLPPYSPDPNPIEMAFANLKAHLAKAKARTIDDLWKAVGSICDLCTPEECWNYLKQMAMLRIKCTMISSRSEHCLRDANWKAWSELPTDRIRDRRSRRAWGKGGRGPLRLRRQSVY